MDKLTSLDDFRAAARGGAALPTSVQRLATGPATEVDGKVRTLRFCFSDGTVDRAGDSINPKGWDLDAFNKNPVVLWAHDSWSPPIGRASNVGAIGKRLMGDVEFASADAYPFAETIFQLTKGGFINAGSVGFNPLEWTFVNEPDRPYGIDFKRQELLEYSVCPVPCNSNALVEARAKGIDTRPMVEWAEKVLDQGGSIIIPRTELEGLRAKAMERPARRYFLTGGKSLTASQLASVKGNFDDWVSGEGKDSLLLPEGVGFEIQVDKTDAPTPTCGNAKDQECGMIDPAQCAMHNYLDEGAKAAHAVKAGRRISAANTASLNKAVEHIQSVLDSNEPAEETPAPETPAAEVVDTIVDPKAAARESAKATLAAARAA